MAADTIDIGEAQRIVAEALRLCRSGDGAAGMARYRSAASPQLLAKLPIGLHVHLLDEAGCMAEAAELRRIAVRRGGDLAWRAARASASPGEIAAEYETLFAAGHANPLMVGRYIGVLTALGRAAEVAALFAPGLLLRKVRLEAGLAEAVAAAMLAEEALLDRGSRLSVREMREIPGVHRRPAFAALMAACRSETARYLADWAASDHPLARHVPEAFVLNAWGLISRGEGYNTRHQHTLGWATGVFYPVGISDEFAGGALRIGGWGAETPPGWPELAIRPEAGMLVLMPSSYVHWTDPLGAPGLRMSVAFDAIPETGPDEDGVGEG
ncbi:putative 2OG-Fe(II) oxygenase [Sphingomonas sp. G-3-2-10]|uniref:putative 2OG-Fe(II) oxygenase n=1 Tax=Sphingomonas sp. G-3-2-10 TaxID=2728838 RepID=UPI00146F8255|nr:hypothetical protein [Sphingomonas sp. G-3-2-10]